MSDVVLEAQDLHKIFVLGEEKINVLRGLNLVVNRGDFIGVVGPSGVGKSTLLHILGGLDHPTEGKVFLDGEEMYKMDDSELARVRNAKIGFIFQFHYLLPEFTALENVMMPGIIGGQPWAEAKKKAKEILEEVGLGHRLEHTPVELSGGEKQRVAIARALFNNPRVVLADEPSGNLDPERAEELHNLLFRLNEQGITFVVATHNMEFVSRMRKVYRLKRGVLEAYEV